MQTIKLQKVIICAVLICAGLWLNAAKLHTLSTICALIALFAILPPVNNDEKELKDND